MTRVYIWAPSQYKDRLSRAWGFRHIFNMQIPILVRRHFYIETAPWFPQLRNEWPWNEYYLNRLYHAELGDLCLMICTSPWCGLIPAYMNRISSCSNNIWDVPVINTFIYYMMNMKIMRLCRLHWSYRMMSVIRKSSKHDRKLNKNANRWRIRWIEASEGTSMVCEMTTPKPPTPPHPTPPCNPPPHPHPHPHPHHHHPPPPPQPPQPPTRHKQNTIK